MLRYNLQFFAKDGPGGEKTEEPTSKKLKDARKDGQVAKSKEIANAATILAMFLLIRIYLGTLGTNFMGFFSYMYGIIPDTIRHYDGEIPSLSIVGAVRTGMIRLLLMVAPFLLTAFGIAFVSDLVQVKWEPTTKPLKPKFKNLNPVNGVKRIFSMNSLINLLKSLLKLILVGAVVYSYVKGIINGIYGLYDLTLKQVIGLLGQIVTDLGIRIAAVYIIIAAADYGYQKWKFHEDMKMTKQEVKDEFKTYEGDPQIKGKQRQRMREASMRRMMQELPSADVVITNPTHYAVAIRYDRGSDDAPFVIAKGADYLAQKIREVAKEHEIYIYEDKPLARMLYANVDLMMPIPPELYEAVANVLAFVYQIEGRLEKTG
ncbi:MAG: flagellar biosynthesis protein FlhB [Lachnospiraceae bacterium]|nr:flagellar biosynthesis protein FlhB [Lachnospiraceae bacterium]